MKEKKISTKATVMTGMFAAILAVMSQIAIPMPSGMPLTLQTFAVALTGFVLGWKMGSIAVFVYLLIGAVGVPVFANFTGGLGILFQSTGGFLFGFLFMAALSGMAFAQKSKGMKVILAAAGLGICHLLGAAQFSAVAGMPFTESFILVSAPYLLKDAVSVALAYFVGHAVKKTLHAANILNYAGV